MSDQQYTEEQLERRRLASRMWKERNKERNALITKLGRQKNPEAHRRSNREHYKRNPDYYLAKCHKYKAAKKKAIPAWANLEEIEELFKKCKELTNNTNISYSVDHIVPLQSDIVCGLHVINNLQIITSNDNFKKGNRSWPDMP